MSNNVEHPKHYNSHPANVECIDIVEHFSFNIGNVIKYVWRAEYKGNELEDLKKAEFYIRREIERRQSCVELPSPWRSFWCSMWASK